MREGCSVIVVVIETSSGGRNAGTPLTLYRDGSEIYISYARRRNQCTTALKQVRRAKAASPRTKAFLLVAAAD